MYNMLRFILDHRKAIDKFTEDKDNELRLYELSLEEWKIVKQLCNILEVCVHSAVQLHNHISH